ncbi:6242_t:CDS:2 [Funneliformis caledonium]|uniref:6242_t:CDS:1 n=1 Tax=Funneliformis caledonium TaxID=1117310 RepID=A0A9N8YP04_9GLOM|nr:6242_t:CDS:2 [Funneliformis caledonium]
MVFVRGTSPPFNLPQNRVETPVPNVINHPSLAYNLPMVNVGSLLRA